VRISYRRRGIPLFGLYTHCVDMTAGYAAATKASVLSPLGLRWQGERPRIFLRPDEEEEADQLLAGLGLRPGQTLISVAPAHHDSARRWPASYYARLIGLLADNGEHRRFLLLRGPGEEDEIRELMSFCPCPDKVLLPPEAPNLRISAACIGRSALFLGNSSSPRHMAVAMRTPSLVMLGNDSPAWDYPDAAHQNLRTDLPCCPCRKDCREPSCFAQATPEMAAAKAESMLNSFGPLP
jgi:heptosyltransferase-2/heptosyltransferase-3